MDAEIDHYVVLGLPSGEEGSKLTEKEIVKAYKSKAFELHPDKRPDDPNAASDFQQLQTSYGILRDDKARKLFDDHLRVKRDHQRRLSQRDGKRRKMVSDLEQRERDASAPDPSVKEREKEARISRQFKEEIAMIRAMHAKKVQVPDASATKKEREGASGGGGIGIGLNKENVLKVSWEKFGEDYSSDKLRELFSKFGEVEDVVMKVGKKRGSALVVMATREGAVAATGSVIGHLANPLLVLPLKPAMPADSFKPAMPADSHKPAMPADSSGAPKSLEEFQAFEDYVLTKLQKAAEKQR
ncbi:uncharacterized protein LOC133308369 [Gastrolobium bilobum]|uniref:uncharacterized protein LOC133308369 n=1 Tax=Gastrolobium bilobum TaxID=150636 RepID=UPI002AB236DC|nr:uncharacterized protein LOC133308369 [Gastrolobium bilobum]